MTVIKKRRIYQVAKEFHLSNEELIEFLHQKKIKVRNHMAPVDEEMYQLTVKEFGKEDGDSSKEPDFRKRIQEKKVEEEARREAIRHEIDEVLERSKSSEFKTVEVVERADTAKESQEKAPAKKVKEKTKPKAEKAAEKAKPAKKKEEAPRPAPVKEPEPEKPEPVSKPEPVVEKKPLDNGIIDHIDLDAIKEKSRIASSKKSKPSSDKKSDSDTDDSASKPKRHLKRRPPVTETKSDEKPEGDSSKRRRKKKGKPETTETKAATDDKGEFSRKKKRRRKKKRSAVKIDEREIDASIKETLAKMSEPTKKRRRKKEKVADEVEIEQDNLIKTTEFISVSELANLMDVESSEVITACMSLGIMVTINQRLDQDTILMVSDEFGYEVEFLSEYGEEGLEKVEEEEDKPEDLKPRPPVVTIMGHVDHGKTSLLDHIRESNIISGESGGITQHIGAYEVKVQNKSIVFLDTPGHEAFTAMRARGAQVTDIVILVVAADDKVMPQTIEAINHARAAGDSGVPIVVAINKMDRPGANPDMIKKQLSENNVLVEEWGGKAQCVEISAKTGEGIPNLLDSILIEAELLELKANPNAKAKAAIIETRMDKGRGVVATVLVQKGTLHKGDSFVAGQFNGRVRAMFDERENQVDEAPPSKPVQVIGFSGMPQAGDLVVAVDSEQEAKSISLKRQQLKREQGFRQVRRLTLEQISKRIAEGDVKELSIVIKADVDGSIEAISDSLMNIGTDDVSVRIIHKGVGNITEWDVLLAEASQAVIIGFHVTPNAQAKELAQKEDVDIRIYKVIYDIVDDIKMALAGMLEPERNEEIVGTVEVREVFKASKVGVIAGSYVLTGKLTRNDMVRVKREDNVVYEGRVSSLKRFKEDVKEVNTGYECGITLDNFKDIQVGDTMEAYRIVETARTL